MPQWCSWSAITTNLSYRKQAMKLKGQKALRKKPNNILILLTEEHFLTVYFFFIALGKAFYANKCPTAYCHMLYMKQPLKCVQKTSADVGFGNLLVKWHFSS